MEIRNAGRNGNRDVTQNMTFDRIGVTVTQHTDTDTDTDTHYAVQVGHQEHSPLPESVGEEVAE